MGGKGPNNSRWKGGRRVRPDGYVDCYCPGHPSACRNRVLEHRLVMEKAIGRYLKRNEYVHHKNENRSDNRLCNLELMTDAEHSRMHSTGRRFPDRFKPRFGRRTLFDLYAKRSLTLRECAAILGMSYGALRHLCLYHKIPIRRTDPWLVRRREKKSSSLQSSSSTKGKSKPTGSRACSQMPGKDGDRSGSKPERATSRPATTRSKGTKAG